MRVERDKTFGLVIAISRHKTIEEVIARANDSDNGLGALVFGGKNAAGVADQLEAGMVGINQFQVAMVSPLGGRETERFRISRLGGRPSSVRPGQIGFRLRAETWIPAICFTL